MSSNVARLIHLFLVAFLLLPISVPVCSPAAAVFASTGETPDGIGPISGERPIVAQVAGRGNSWLNLQDGMALPARYTGPSAPVEALSAGQAVPLSLAAGDFDEDGMPDLVAGYTLDPERTGGSEGEAVLALHRGNVDALYPNSGQAQRRKATGTWSDAPFLPEAAVVPLPAAPDWLAAGDFDGDGHLDVVAAARGTSALVLLAGDGRGGFRPPQTVPLPGGVTALAAGEVSRRDGLADLAVAIGSISPGRELAQAPDPSSTPARGIEEGADSPPTIARETGARPPAVRWTGGPCLLVFEGPVGALQHAPEVIPLPAEAVGLALGQLDGDYPLDLAAATASQLLVIHGRDRELSMDAARQAAVPPAVIDTFSLPYSAVALATGNFVLDVQGTYRLELALLATDGAVHILEPASGTERVQPSGLPASLPGGFPGRQLLAARVSSLPTDDLIVFDAAGRQISLLLAGPAGPPPIHHESVESPILLDLAGAPAAICPMRLNVDALDDLVVLAAGSSAPAVVHTAPLSTFTVVTAQDGSDECAVGDGVCAVTEWQGDPAVCVVVGDCTLRAALEEANHGPGADLIGFALPGSATIQSPTYFAADYPVTIDGTTQPGYAGSPVVELTGSPSVNLFLSGGNSVVRGLAFTGAVQHGLQVDNFSGWNGGNTILEGNYFGLKPGGDQCDGNAELGLEIWDVPNNRVGGTVEAARNVLSCNGAHGLQISETAAAALNRVIGNYIGTDAGGTLDRGNLGSGVAVAGGPNNDVGGSTAAERNVIARNRNGAGSGVAVAFPESAGNLVVGNYIGVDKNAALLANASDGVALVEDAHHNTVGGTAGVAPGGPCQGECNLIAGNLRHGVYMGVFAGRATPRPASESTRAAPTFLVADTQSAGQDRESNMPTAVTGNLVRGNFIGSALAGQTGVANGGDGVHLLNAPGNTIGGATEAFRNVISGNDGRGVYLGGSGSTGNTVQYNHVGLNAAGDGPVSNVGDGVAVDGGGDTSISNNVISGNGGNGVYLAHGTRPGNRLEQNTIGLNAAGSAKKGNSRSGVWIHDAPDNTLDGNVIGGNVLDGVTIEGTAATENALKSNRIGTNAAGTADLGNVIFGVGIMDGAGTNAIGGPEPGYGNTIAFQKKGIVVVDAGTGNALLGNSIYSNREMGIDLGDDGWTKNDTGDGDPGPNNLQNFPALSDVRVIAGSTVISGTLRGQPNTTYYVEFLANTQCEASHLIQGKTLLGGIEVTTGFTGTAAFNKITFAGSYPIVTATATDPDGNTSEFAPPDLRITGVEVNQSVGNLNNDITMVVNKSTLVRVFIRSVSCDVPNVTARLTRQLTGDPQPLLPQPALVTAKAQPVARPTRDERSQLKNSLNFILPAGWLWHEKVWDLYADLNPACLQPDADCDPDPGDVDGNLQHEPVAFETEPSMNLLLVNVLWRSWRYGTLHKADPGNALAIADRVEAMFPVAAVNKQLWQMEYCCTVTEDPAEFTYLRLRYALRHAFVMAALRGEIQLPAGALLYGYLGDAESGQGGLLKGVAAGGVKYGRYSASFVATHELGHCFGMGHICTENGGEPWCGSGPYPDPIISPTENPALGTTVYGYDFGEDRPNQIVHAYSAWENMTYPGLTEGSGRWLSRWSWDKVRTQRAADAARPQVGESPATEGEYLLVSGVISITQAAADLSPVYRLLDVPAQPLPEPGDYSLDLYAGDTLLATYPFTASADIHVPPEYGQFAIFSEVVPHAPGTTRLEVKHGAQVLAVRAASTYTPTIDITYPQGGEVLTGTVTVTWAASDADGDTLAYSVLYSRDDGQTWQPLTVNWPGTSLEVDTAALPGSGQARLQVLATDGWNTGVDTTAAFQVQTKGPSVVAILTPADGVVFGPGDPVQLHGSAWDEEDGVLTGTLLVWTDTVSGVLGTGETLYPPALAPGRHTITLTATDRDGLSSARSIQIVIRTGKVYLPLIVRGYPPPTWHSQCVDCPPMIGDLTYRAQVIDSAGHPHVAYGGDVLYHAWHDGAAWHVQVADPSPGVGEDASVALDSAGRPHIAYRDGVNNCLKYARWDGASQTWQNETVDCTGSQVGREPFIVLDGDDRPHISFADWVWTDEAHLRYAHWNGTAWQVETVEEGQDDQGHPVQAGYPSSLAVDSSGRPHIAYRLSGWGADPDKLKYASWDGTQWQKETVATSDYISEASLVLDGSDGPHLGFDIGGTLRYAHWTGAQWQTQTVVTSPDGLEGACLALDGAGQPRFSYYYTRYVPGTGNLNDLRYTWWNGSAWPFETLDGGFWIDAYDQTSLALDSSGRPFILYETAQDFLLKHARRPAASWQIETIAQAGSAGLYTSLALDGAGRTHVAYVDQKRAALRYARWDGTAWQIQTAAQGEWSVDIGMPSLALEAGTDYPRIAFTSPDGLQYAAWNGTSWQLRTVDPEIDEYEGGGPSLALDSAGRAHISYFTADQHRYARWTGTTWQISVVDAGSGGSIEPDRTSLALDAADRPHIAYADSNTWDLKYARWDGSAWHLETVESTGQAGLYFSLVLDGTDQPRIAYMEFDNYELRYARREGSGWQIETVDGDGQVGYFASLALDAAGHPNISYHDSDNDTLEYARWDGTQWQITTLESGNVGWWTSLALDPDGRPHIAHYDRSLQDLRYTWFGR